MCFALKLQGQKKSSSHNKHHISKRAHTLLRWIIKTTKCLFPTIGAWKLKTLTASPDFELNCGAANNKKQSLCLWDRCCGQTRPPQAAWNTAPAFMMLWVYGLCCPPPVVVGNYMVMVSISVRHSPLPETPTSTRKCKCSCLVYCILWYKLSQLKITEDERYCKTV